MELQEYKSYQQYKAELDMELGKEAEGFVRIGYLLKVARDTNVLYESGYLSVAEFAQKEYGLTKDIVSRYIAINDRYSEGGYSEHLQERFSGFGVAKLAEMLTLPESLVEAIPVELTRKEIQEIKQEIREEEAKTDIEVILEGEKEEHRELTLLQKVFFEYFHQNRERFCLIYITLIASGMEKNMLIDGIMNAMAPSGTAMVITRIQGIGKLALAIKGEQEKVELINLRTNEKISYTWEEITAEMKTTFNRMEMRVVGTAEKAWEGIYGEPYVEAESVPEVVTVPTSDIGKAIHGIEHQAFEAAVSKQPESASKPAETLSKPEEQAAESEETPSEEQEALEIENVNHLAEVVEEDTGSSIEESYEEKPEVAPVQPKLPRHEAEKRKREWLDALKESLDTLHIAATKGMWGQVDRCQSEVRKELDELKELEKHLEVDK